ncbi:hypothetical protein Cadr_000022503 [Camelus dromedarius]|uniref:Uncharacterized protein n=1 Tax=Camelus dromedarius TaxID=9838 RepID=A0A5N4CRK6_CAMDR|nr:hypothetical protein Cadr_000022503 [Camelus dromedarius]
MAMRRKQRDRHGGLNYPVRGCVFPAVTAACPGPGGAKGTFMFRLRVCAGGNLVRTGFSRGAGRMWYFEFATQSYTLAVPETGPVSAKQKRVPAPRPRQVPPTLRLVTTPCYLQTRGALYNKALTPRVTVFTDVSGKLKQVMSGRDRGNTGLWEMTKRGPQWVSVSKNCNTARTVCTRPQWYPRSSHVCLCVCMFYTRALNQGGFDPYPGDMWPHLESLLGATTEGRCPWHLNYLPPNVHSAAAENPFPAKQGCPGPSSYQRAGSSCLCLWKHHLTFRPPVTVTLLLPPLLTQPRSHAHPGPLPPLSTLTRSSSESPRATLSKAAGGLKTPRRQTLNACMRAWTQSGARVQGPQRLGTLNGRPVPLLPSTLSSQEAFLDFSPENLEHPQKLQGNKLRPANLTEPTWAREEAVGDLQPLQGLRQTTQKSLPVLCETAPIIDSPSSVHLFMFSQHQEKDPAPNQMEEGVAPLASQAEGKFPWTGPGTQTTRPLLKTPRIRKNTLYFQPPVCWAFYSQYFDSPVPLSRSHSSASQVNRLRGRARISGDRTLSNRAQLQTLCPPTILCTLGRGAGPGDPGEGGECKLGGLPRRGTPSGLATAVAPHCDGHAWASVLAAPTHPAPQRLISWGRGWSGNTLLRPGRRPGSGPHPAVPTSRKRPATSGPGRAGPGWGTNQAPRGLLSELGQPPAPCRAPLSGGHTEFQVSPWCYAPDTDSWPSPWKCCVPLGLRGCWGRPDAHLTSPDLEDRAGVRSILDDTPPPAQAGPGRTKPRCCDASSGLSPVLPACCCDSLRTEGPGEEVPLMNWPWTRHDLSALPGSHPRRGDGKRRAAETRPACAGPGPFSPGAERDAGKGMGPFPSCVNVNQLLKKICLPRHQASPTPADHSRRFQTERYHHLSYLTWFLQEASNVKVGLEEVKRGGGPAITTVLTLKLGRPRPKGVSREKHLAVTIHSPSQGKFTPARLRQDHPESVQDALPGVRSAEDGAANDRPARTLRLLKQRPQGPGEPEHSPVGGARPLPRVPWGAGFPRPGPCLHNSRFPGVTVRKWPGRWRACGMKAVQFTPRCVCNGSEKFIRTGTWPRNLCLPQNQKKTPVLDVSRPSPGGPGQHNPRTGFTADRGRPGRCGDFAQATRAPESPDLIEARKTRAGAETVSPGPGLESPSATETFLPVRPTPPSGRSIPAHVPETRPRRRQTEPAILGSDVRRGRNHGQDMGAQTSWVSSHLCTSLRDSHLTSPSAGKQAAGRQAAPKFPLTVRARRRAGTSLGLSPLVASLLFTLSLCFLSLVSLVVRHGPELPKSYSGCKTDGAQAVISEAEIINVKRFQQCWTGRTHVRFLAPAETVSRIPGRLLPSRPGLAALVQPGPRGRRWKEVQAGRWPLTLHGPEGQSSQHPAGPRALSTRAGVWRGWSLAQLGVTGGLPKEVMLSGGQISNEQKWLGQDWHPRRQVLASLFTLGRGREMVLHRWARPGGRVWTSAFTLRAREGRADGTGSGCALGGQKSGPQSRGWKRRRRQGPEAVRQGLPPVRGTAGVPSTQNSRTPGVCSQRKSHTKKPILGREKPRGEARKRGWAVTAEARPLVDTHGKDDLGFRTPALRWPCPSDAVVDGHFQAPSDNAACFLVTAAVQKLHVLFPSDHFPGLQCSFLSRYTITCPLGWLQTTSGLSACSSTGTFLEVLGFMGQARGRGTPSQAAGLSCTLGPLLILPVPSPPLQALTQNPSHLRGSDDTLSSRRLENLWTQKRAGTLDTCLWSTRNAGSRPLPTGREKRFSGAVTSPRGKALKTPTSRVSNNSSSRVSQPPSQSPLQLDMSEHGHMTQVYQTGAKTGWTTRRKDTDEDQSTRANLQRLREEPTVRTRALRQVELSPCSPAVTAAQSASEHNPNVTHAAEVTVPPPRDPASARAAAGPQSAPPLLEEVHAPQLLGQVLLVHRLAVRGVVLVALAVAQVLHESGGRVAQVQRDGGQRARVAPQAGLHVVVGAEHLDGLGGSGQVDHALGQEHLDEKATLLRTLPGLQKVRRRPPPHAFTPPRPAVCVTRVAHDRRKALLLKRG